MTRAALLILLVLALDGCGTAPGPTRASGEPYSVISEQADPVAGSLILSIRTAGAASQSNVKAIAEAAIAARKGKYSRIVVRAYAEGSDATDEPFLTSRLERDVITHSFNAQAETKKIPTH